MPIEPQGEGYDELDIYMEWELTHYTSLLGSLSPAIKRKLSSTKIVPSIKGCNTIIKWCEISSIKTELSKEVSSEFSILAIIHIRDAYKNKSNHEYFSCYECLGNAQANYAKATFMLDLKNLESNLLRDNEIHKNKFAGAMLPHIFNAHVLSKFMSNDRQQRLQKGIAKTRQTKTEKILSAAKAIGWNLYGLEKITDEVIKNLNPKGNIRGLSRKTIYRVLKEAGHKTNRTGIKKQLPKS